MADMTRDQMILGFDSIRPSFLAALDQIIAEVRPKLTNPGFYEASLLMCASAFADPALVREQLKAIDPGLVDALPDSELESAHVATLAYLFALTMHELMRAGILSPTPLPEGAEE